MENHKKKTSKEISDLIRKGSKFVYFDGIAYSASTSETKVNRENLEYKIVTAVITKGDYYLLEAVHSLGFATAESLLHKFRAGGRRYEEASICLAQEGKVTNHRTMRGRLEFLARQGLLHCHEYIDAYENVNYVYTCSSEGFRAFSNALDRRVPYNKDMVYKPPYEVFRYLAANTVGYVLGMHPDCKKIYPYGRINYKVNGKDRMEQVFGHLEFQKEGGKLTHYILEPTFFSINPKIISWDENKERIRKRIETLRELVRSLCNENEEAYLIFIVENGDGLSRLKETIMEFEMDFFFERCLFTSENTVSMVFTERGTAADDCLLGIFVQGSQIRFKQRDMVE